MGYVSVIDTTSIIWDNIDYQANRTDYYKLLMAISRLLLKFEHERPDILIRNGMIKEMLNGFPFKVVHKDFWDVCTQVCSILGKVGANIVSFPANTSPTLTSDPNLIEPYFNQATQNEVRYLIYKIHNNDDTDTVYFTFQYLWHGGDKLQTEDGPVEQREEKKHTRILSDNGTDLDDFFAALKPEFEHSSKHDSNDYNDRAAWENEENKDSFTSRLSCYKDRNIDKPRELLSGAMESGGVYYNYDYEHETYVVFRCHDANKYHGYDQYDIQAIPHNVKKRYNIWR